MIGGSHFQTIEKLRKLSSMNFARDRTLLQRSYGFWKVGHSSLLQNHTKTNSFHGFACFQCFRATEWRWLPTCHSENAANYGKCKRWPSKTHAKRVEIESHAPDCPWFAVFSVWQPATTILWLENIRNTLKNIIFDKCSPAKL